VYALYAASADEWGTPHSDERRRSELFAEALAQVWHERHPRATRYSLMVANEPVVVLSQSSGGPARLLLASTDFVRTQWLASAEAVAREQQLSVSVRGSRDARLFEFGPDTRGVAAAAANSVTRTAVQTTLPWTIVVTGQNTAEDQRFAERRRLLVAGFVLLLVMALAASYAITRAVSREIAVGRLQSDFVAAVSHEFRTPLTTLRQFTDMLREQRQLTDERRRLCYDAQARATERLTRLVESVLDFGRLEAGARPYRFELCDCTELVSRVVQDFRGEPKAAEHDLQFRASGAVPIDADAEALARAVWNLIDNAVKYSPEGGPVEVNVTTGSGSVSITVRDHGIGIPAGERQAIFGKFQRGEQARLRGIKGTGIGLAMVDHIVKAHRGHIHVQGEPGAGSTFTIVLPAPASQTLQRHPHVHAEASTCASGGATLPTALG
jgi:signal transduction histidine kinase